jgi:hypothetical protein
MSKIEYVSVKLFGMTESVRKMIFCEIPRGYMVVNESSESAFKSFTVNKTHSIWRGQAFSVSFYPHAHATKCIVEKISMTANELADKWLRIEGIDTACKAIGINDEINKLLIPCGSVNSWIPASEVLFYKDTINEKWKSTVKETECQ